MHRCFIPSALAITAALVACGSDEPAAERSSGPERTTSETIERPRDSARPDGRLSQPLIASAARGDTERVQGLLARGADVRARVDRGRTALTAAAFENRVAVARELVRAGADVNAKDETEQSSYLVSTSEVGDDPRLLDLMLSSGAKIDDKDSYNGTGLIRAAERGHPRIVRRLLRAGIDRGHVNRLGWTALHEAIVLGDGGPAHVETVRALVDGGVDVNVRGGSGRPLTHAEQRGYGEIVAILREAGGRR